MTMMGRSLLLMTVVMMTVFLLVWAACMSHSAVFVNVGLVKLNQVDVKDDKGCTPCLMAALNGHLETVELLVDRFKSKVGVC